jgi:hypothetical protein
LDEIAKPGDGIFSVQDFFAYVGADNVRHPFSKARCAVEPPEDLAPVGIFHVKVVRKTEAEDGGDGANTVFPVDFLSFLISAAGVTYGNLKDPRPALRELDGKFRLDLESLANQGDTLEQGRPNHLVTGFHVS